MLLGPVAWLVSLCSYVSAPRHSGRRVRVINRDSALRMRDAESERHLRVFGVRSGRYLANLNAVPPLSHASLAPVALDRRRR